MLLSLLAPQNPREGGVILSQMKNRESLETLLQQDPFYIHEVADYQIVEFYPMNAILILNILWKTNIKRVRNKSAEQILGARMHH